MDDTEDDAGYPPNPSHPHGVRDHSSTSHRPKLLLRSAATITNNGSRYDDEDDDAEEEEEGDNYEDDDDPPQQQQQQRQRRPRTTRRPDHEDDDVEDDGEEEPREDSRDYARRPNKLNYEFAPRAAAAASRKPKQPPSAHQKPAPAEWTAEATDVLLEVWGTRFLELGRKSLRSDEWVGVAKKVSAITKTHVTDTQCRNRLDTLKKKYKKEKMKLAESSGGGSGSSRWVYFTRMESLLSSSSLSQPPPQHFRQQLACGFDAGEYVFSNSRAYMNQPNGVDEIRDSTESDSGNDQEAEDDDDGDSDFPPPRKVKRTSASGRTAEEEDEAAASFRMLTESIRKFGEIYEKVENSKRQQMMELEKMRMEFQREMEMQKRQILERAQEEIERIQKEDDDVDTAVTNVSG